MAKAKVLSKEEIKRVMRIADTGRNGLRDRVALSLTATNAYEAIQMAKAIYGRLLISESACSEV